MDELITIMWVVGYQKLYRLVIYSLWWYSQRVYFVIVFQIHVKANKKNLSHSIKTFNFFTLFIRTF